jgi:hypothetical protein
MDEHNIDKLFKQAVAKKKYIYKHSSWLKAQAGLKAVWLKALGLKIVGASIVIGGVTSAVIIHQKSTKPSKPSAEVQVKEVIHEPVVSSDKQIAQVYQLESSSAKLPKQVQIADTKVDRKVAYKEGKMEDGFGQHYELDSNFIADSMNANSGLEHQSSDFDSTHRNENTASSNETSDTMNLKPELDSTIVAYNSEPKYPHQVPATRLNDSQLNRSPWSYTGFWELGFSRINTQRSSISEKTNSEAAASLGAGFLLSRNVKKGLLTVGLKYRETKQQYSYNQVLAQKKTSDEFVPILDSGYTGPGYVYNPITQSWFWVPSSNGGNLFWAKVNQADTTYQVMSGNHFNTLKYLELPLQYSHIFISNKWEFHPSVGITPAFLIGHTGYRVDQQSLELRSLKEFVVRPIALKLGLSAKVHYTISDDFGVNLKASYFQNVLSSVRNENGEEFLEEANIQFGFTYWPLKK